MLHAVSPPPGVVPCDSLPMYATPKCSTTCTDRTYASRYNNDKRLARTSYSVTGEKNMQKELMEKGTMTVAFTVFEDFELYKEGVYQHVKGKDVCVCLCVCVCIFFWCVSMCMCICVRLFPWGRKCLSTCLVSFLLLNSISWLTDWCAYALTDRA